MPSGPATFGDRPVVFLPAWREQLGGLAAALHFSQGGGRRPQQSFFHNCSAACDRSSTRSAAQPADRQLRRNVKRIDGTPVRHSRRRRVALFNRIEGAIVARSEVLGDTPGAAAPPGLGLRRVNGERRRNNRGRERDCGVRRDPAMAVRVADGSGHSETPVALAR